MRRKAREQTIFFPWERPGSFVRRLGLSRARIFFAFAFFVGLFVVLGVRERRTIGVRLTRATIGVVAKGVDKYRADHQGKCPADLAALKAEGYIAFDPKDAWGRELRLLCPGFTNTQGYDLMSDGPDGAFGGLDRVE
ncbi:MAG: type II secretion system protein GspG [Polyangiaceae bacterium]|nr:type II secretion system protein GspG [Polyangiaceae bacterium]MBK8940677.1 type II secretion system protein GspG [Polyangiaceae bacterium]